MSAVLLAGCANGDFQRVRPGLVGDDTHDWLGRETVTGQGIAPSRFHFTDDERELRDLAYGLIQPPYDRQKWYSVLGDYGLIESDRGTAFDRAAYLNHLKAAYYRSSSARYARLLDDIRNDETQLPQFFAAASRVLDMDRKRRESLRYISGLSPSERADAIRRVRENKAVVALVRTKLVQRTAGYRFALEQLVVRTPSAQAAAVEHALNRLRATLAWYDRYPAGTWIRQPSLASSS